MKTIGWLSVFVMIYGGLVSCVKTGQTIYQPVNSQEIRIGAMLPLTGTGSSAGAAAKASLELAVEDITAYLQEAGTGETLVLEVADTQTDTMMALSRLKSLYQNGIRLVVGPYSSAELAHIKPFADSNGMLIVSHSSVAVSLAIPNDNIYRFVSSDLVQGKAMSKLLADDKIKVIVAVVRNDLWGNDLVEATGSFFAKAGGIVQEVIKYEPGTIDFTETLRSLDNEVAFALVHHNPNEVAVYMLSFDEGTQMLAAAKNYTSLNNVYWYGGSAFAQNAPLLNNTDATLFAYSHGLPCPVFGLDDEARYRWQPLVERIEQKIGRPPDVYAITAYDALWVMVRAARAAGKKASIKCLKRVFTEESNVYFGASGNTLLDENGDRANGNYDFWAVKSDTAGYQWKRVARYNSATGSLIRLTK